MQGKNIMLLKIGEKANMNEIVSIVVPIYNVEKYLKKCIESILIQSYKNIQIILVDDGSTDNSSIICDEYAKKDERIYVVHKPNGGLSDARNVGLEKVIGAYFCFIDGDDYIHKDYIKEMLFCAKKYNADLTICDFCRVFGNKKIKERRKGSVKIYDKNLPNLLYTKLKFVGGVAWNKLYKSIVYKNNLKYPIKKFHEDDFVAPYVFYLAKKVVYLKKVLYYYNIRQDSITNNLKYKREDAYEAQISRLNFYKGNTQIIKQIYCNYLCMLIVDLKTAKKLNDVNKIKIYKNNIKNFRKQNKNICFSPKQLLKIFLVIIGVKRV